MSSVILTTRRAVASWSKSCSRVLAAGLLSICTVASAARAAGDDLNISQKLAPDNWPEVCARALKGLHKEDDPRYRVVFDDPETIEFSNPIAWLDAYDYRIPVPLLEGAEWHYQAADPDNRLQMRYGRFMALEVVHEKQEVLEDIADVTGFVAKTSPDNAAHRKALMADIFGKTYTLDDAFLNALQTVPSELDCGRDRLDLIEDMLALTNKTDVIESAKDRAYRYYGAFDGFVVARELEKGTLWTSRVWRSGRRLSVALYVSNKAPPGLQRIGMGLVHPDFMEAPAAELPWVEQLNEVFPESLKDPLPVDAIAEVLGPLMKDDSGP